MPKAPLTIGTIVTFMFHSFFNSLARSRYLSFFSHSFRFILWSAVTAKSTILQILFFLLIIIIISSSCSSKSRISIYSFRVFHISVSWWSLTGVWATVSFLKSPGLFTVFWPFSIMLWFGWSPLVRQLPSPSVPLIILYLLYQKLQSIYIFVTFMFHSFFSSLASSRYLSFFSHSFSFILWSAGTEKSTNFQILFFFVVVDYYKVWSSGRD